MRRRERRRRLKNAPFGYSPNKFRRDNFGRVFSCLDRMKMNAVVSPLASGYRLIPADVGIGLCPEHHALVLDRQPQVAWFEVRAETLWGHGDWLRDVVSVGRDYPLSVHATGLSLGSVTPPEAGYLRRLSELVTRLQPDFVSVNPPDLLPLTYTEETLASVVRNVTHVQDTLRRQILLDTPFKRPERPEAALSEEAFLAEVVLRTGCGIVLDLHNLHSSATELGIDASAALERFLETLEPESIAEIHLAVHSDPGSTVYAAVWELFERTVATIGPIPTLLESDTSNPAFEALQTEAATARSIMMNSTRHTAT